MIFVLSYLRVALTFKLVFSIDPNKAQKMINRRILFVRVFGVVFFMATSFPWFVAAVVDYNENLQEYLEWAVDVYWVTTPIFMTYSICRIYRYLKQLSNNSDFSNEITMVFHLSFVILSAAARITQHVFFIVNHSE